jgi:hypothetical protein
VAPTGVAAINAGGTTIHSFFQLPFTPFIPPADKTKSSEESKRLMGTIKLTNVRRAVMQQLELLIIDEVSMVRADVLDAIDVVLRSVRRTFHLPFGGVQVFFIGDMYQLPPVTREEEWSLISAYYKSPFFFDANVVKELHPVYIELDKIFRQKEQTFVDLLNRVRNNELDEISANILNSRYNPDPNAEKDAIVLATHNYIADSINSSELEKINSPLVEYKAVVKNQFSEKSYPVEEVIRLKLGAKVMFVKNDSSKRFFNGKIGVVCKLEKEVISVMCDGESFPIRVTTEIWKNIQYGMNKTTNQIQEDVLGSFEQYPLRLAWAITIHKSQGLTFDKVEIDAEKAFSAGQVYVALSRCRSLEGIVLRSKISLHSLANNDKVVEFARQKPEEKVVERFLTEGKSNYVQKLIVELFDFNQLVYLTNDLVKGMEQYQLYFSSENLVWVNNFKANVIELRSIAQKFERQITQLFENVTDELVVDERLEKASRYFQNELNVFLEKIKTTPLITESKEAGREISGVLEHIFRFVYTRHHLLKSCITKFSLSEYVVIKNSVSIPEYTPTVYAIRQRKIDSSIPHPALYEQLQDLRDTICEEENTPIYLVANKAALLDLCTHLPRTKANLLEMKGFGKAKVNSIGPRFLKIINDYIEEHNLESDLEFAFQKTSQKAKKSIGQTQGKDSDTKTLSFELFKEVKSIEQVAKARALATTTIEGHLAHFVKTGQLSIRDLMDEEKENHLSIIFKDTPSFNSFKEVIEKCREGITYGDLKIFAASHNISPDNESKS